MEDKPIAGYTHEGFPVVKSEMNTGLEFTLISVGRDESNGVSISIGWNKTPKGSHRPYLAVHFGSILIQSGWLF